MGYYSDNFIVLKLVCLGADRYYRNCRVYVGTDRWQLRNQMETFSCSTYYAASASTPKEIEDLETALGQEQENGKLTKLWVRYNNTSIIAGLSINYVSVYVLV